MAVWTSLSKCLCGHTVYITSLGCRRQIVLWHDSLVIFCCGDGYNLIYRKFVNFRCKNIFEYLQVSENLKHENYSMVHPCHKKSEHSLDILRGKHSTTPPFIMETENWFTAFRGVSRTAPPLQYKISYTEKLDSIFLWMYAVLECTTPFEVFTWSFTWLLINSNFFPV